jgi:hypothetical protein
VASPLNPVSEVAAQLLRRAREPRVKLLGFDADLSAIAVAFARLGEQYAAMLEELAQIRGRLDPKHPADCECRNCCLLRIASFNRGQLKSYDA